MHFHFKWMPIRKNVFLKELQEQTPVSVMFQVVQGGHLDIDVTYKAPDGRVLYVNQRQTEGKTTFVTHVSGTYSFCFGNTMSTVTSKIISLVITVSNDDHHPKNDINDAAKTHEVNELAGSLYELENGLNEVVKDQDYMKMRERAHRNTNESTNSRVIWWTTLEIVVLVGMSIFQVYYLKVLLIHL